MLVNALKKLLLFILVVFIGVNTIGCSFPKLTEEQKQYIAEHREVGYSTSITVVVENINKHYWYASGTHYEITIDVYCKEYDEHGSFVLYGADAINAWDIENGDTLSASMWTRAYEISGEIISRSITNLYP